MHAKFSNLIHSPDIPQMWSMDKMSATRGARDTVNMPSHISLRGSISAGIKFSSKLEVGLKAQITVSNCSGETSW